MIKKNKRFKNVTSKNKISYFPIFFCVSYTPYYYSNSRERNNWDKRDGSLEHTADEIRVMQVPGKRNCKRVAGREVR